MLDQTSLHQNEFGNDFGGATAPVSPAFRLAQISLCSGTTVLTMAGEKQVDDLAPGDKIITRDSGIARLCDVVMTEDDVTPIRILAGSLGHTRPDRDTIVGPDAMIHIRDWRADAMFGKPTASVQARRLIDDEFVAELAPARMRFATLCFERAHIIYADGLELCTSAA